MSAVDRDPPEEFQPDSSIIQGERIQSRRLHTVADKAAQTVDQDDETVANQADQPAPKPLIRTATVPTIVGALAGAIMAAVTVLLMTELRPPLDPRLPRFAEQVGGFQQEVFNLETAVRAVEVDLVRALEADSILAENMKAQQASLEQALTSVANTQKELAPDIGVGSAVFGVAVVQLASASENGRPFETEWTNLRALTDDGDALRGELQRLIQMSGTGVPTIPELRDLLQKTANARGVPVIDPNDLITNSMNFLQTSLGVPIGTTAENQVVRSLLTEVDRRLGERNVTGAVQMLGNLSAETSVPFETWRREARRWIAAQSVSAKFQTVARDGIRARSAKK